MSRTLVFVAHGISRDTARLQPWRYLLEIAERLAASGKYRTVIITDGTKDTEDDCWHSSLRILKTRFLSPDARAQLLSMIADLNPRQVWWSITPRSIIYWNTIASISCEVVGVVTCPLYTYRQLARASLSGVPYVELKALWKQRLMPRWLFARMLGGGLFHKVLAQSQANLDILLKSGVPKDRLALLRVGIDSVDLLQTGSSQVRQADGDLAVAMTTFLYFGAVRRIRGFDALLAAFALARERGMLARLVVLARGADAEGVTAIERAISAYGLSTVVSVKGGWLTREQVHEEIDKADAAVLPFVIVPSDVPIAILESMARGKPVIGSNIDGIPELIENRGLVVDPLNPSSFAQTLHSFASDPSLRAQLSINARTFMRTYPVWEKVGEQALLEAGL